MNRISNYALAAPLALLLFLAPQAEAQTNTDPTQSVNRIGASPQNGDEMAHGESHGGESQHNDAPPLPQFSGNLPSTINEDRTHGVNAPGTMIGPAPENGQPDPRFPNSPGTSGGGSEINAQSPSSGASQVPVGQSKYPGMGQVGGTTSDPREGLPSASKHNDGHNSTSGSGGTSGGAGGNEGNPGGAARLDNPAQKDGNAGDVGRETRGAAPFAFGALAVIIGAFLFGMIRSRNRRRA